MCCPSCRPYHCAAATAATGVSQRSVLRHMRNGPALGHLCPLSSGDVAASAGSNHYWRLGNVQMWQIAKWYDSGVPVRVGWTSEGERNIYREDPTAPMRWTALSLGSRHVCALLAPPEAATGQPYVCTHPFIRLVADLIRCYFCTALLTAAHPPAQLPACLLACPPACPQAAAPSCLPALPILSSCMAPCPHVSPSVPCPAPMHCSTVVHRRASKLVLHPLRCQ